MSIIKVRFLHPSDCREITLLLDSTTTALEAIGELISSDFINDNRRGYYLSVKDGLLIKQAETFADAGIKEGEILRIIPAPRI